MTFRLIQSREKLVRLVREPIGIGRTDSLSGNVNRALPNENGKIPRIRKHVIKPITGLQGWSSLGVTFDPPTAIPRISLGAAIWFYRSRALSSSSKCLAWLAWDVKNVDRAIHSVRSTEPRSTQPAVSLEFRIKGRKRPWKGKGEK